MPRKPQEIVVCQICKKQKKAAECVLGEVVRESVTETILRKHPDWNPSGYICLGDLNAFRAEHVREVLETEKGELSALERDVVRSLEEQDVISKNVETEFERGLTLGERMADRVAIFGGSWTFVLVFMAVIMTWIALNTISLLSEAFDPYPYILLNLVLSTVAALQAPIIMMSQHRQEERDRLRAQEDYRVNLKAELEIRHLNEKVDHLLSNQWQRLLEIQQIQTEIMAELAKARPREAYPPQTQPTG